MNIQRRQWLLSSSAAWLGFAAAAVRAQAWPSKPVSLVVPFAAGGGTDTLARTIGEQLGRRLGQTFIVENKPGAGGNIGAEAVARDTSGHQLLFTTASVAVNKTLYKNLRFDITRDFRPVALVTSSPLVLVVSAKSAAGSLEGLAELARSKPAGLDFGSTGAGTTSHLGGALLSQVMQMKAVHIPFRGAGPLLTALVGGQLDFALLAAVAVMPQIRNGQLRALGIAGKKPLPDLATVPRLAEKRPQLEVDNWQALFAPASLPGPALARLAAAMTELLKDGEVRSRIYADGATPVGLGPEATAPFLAAEIKRYADLIKATGATVD
jgi:tripartite-type tricarboxylate transporter receptor subunit TctC